MDILHNFLIQRLILCNTLFHITICLLMVDCFVYLPELVDTGKSLDKNFEYCPYFHAETIL